MKAIRYQKEQALSDGVGFIANEAEPDHMNNTANPGSTPDASSFESLNFFEKRLDFSTFTTGVAIPVKSHHIFLSNLSKTLSREPFQVTLYFQNKPYSAYIRNIASLGKRDCIMFLWTKTLAQKIQSMFYDVFTMLIIDRKRKEDVFDTLIITCGDKPDEFKLDFSRLSNSRRKQRSLAQVAHNSGEINTTNDNKSLSIDRAVTYQGKNVSGLMSQNDRAHAGANDLIAYLNLQKDAIKRSRFLEAQYNQEDEKTLPPKHLVPFLEKTIGEIFVFNTEIRIINDFYFSSEVVSLLKYGVFYSFESRSLIETTTIEYFIILLQDKFADFWNSLLKCASKILQNTFSIENSSFIFQTEKIDQYVFPYTLFKQEEFQLLNRNGVNSWQEYTRYMTAEHSVEDADSILIGYLHSQRLPSLCTLLSFWDTLIKTNPIDVLFPWADKRNLNIYKIRIQARKTLEEVSSLTFLTRERVRQITSLFDQSLIERSTSINNDITLDRALFLYYNSLLFFNKGVLSRDSIVKDVEYVWEWERDLSGFVEHVLEICCTCSHLSKQLISNSNHCIECERLTKHILSHLKNEKAITLEKQLSIARKLCSTCTKSNPFVGNIKDFLPLFYNHVLKDDIVQSKNGALSFSGTSRHTVKDLFSRGQILSFDEIEQELLKYDPQTKRNAIRSFIQHADLVSVDRGKYLLRKFLPKIPTTLNKKIFADIRKRIAKDPYGIISMEFVFEEYCNALETEGIKSAYFLYAVLKESQPKGIRFFRFPFLTSEKNEYHFTVTDQIVMYVEINGKKPLSDVRKHFVQDLGVNAQTFSNIIMNSPQLIVNDDNEIMTVNQLGILDWKMSTFIPFKKQLDSLTGSDSISVKKIFADNKSTCLSLDIIGPKMLFNILKFTYPQFSFRWPQIAKSKKNLISIQSMIIDHIRESGSFCTTEDLINFCNEKHFSGRVYLNHQTDPEIFRYLDGAYVHRDTIGYQPEWDTIIGDVARNVLNDSTSPQQSYAHLNDICDREDSLPVLSGDLWWTPTLVGDILESTGLFLVYGKNKSIFSSLGDSNNLKCFGDLCAVLLDADFDGAANLTQFSDYLREKELISAKLLTKSFLQGSDRIVIDNQEIYTVK